MIQSPRAWAGLVPAIALLLPVLGSPQTQADPAPSPLTTYILAAQVDGVTLKTLDGRSIGEIDDLIIDTGGNSVAFAIVSTGGFLGIGDRLTAIPFELLKWCPTDTGADLCADLDTHNLGMAPVYQHADLLKHLASKQWREETRAAFGTYPDGAEIEEGSGGGSPDGNPMDGAGSRWRRLGDATSVRVLAAASGSSPAGEPTGLGKVEDLVLTRTGCKVVAYVVAAGGVAGLGSDRFVVPARALRKSERPQELRLGKTLEEMRSAPRAEKDIAIRLENAEYRDGLAAFYGVPLGA